MALSIEESKELKERIHNLDLNLEAHREIYNIERYNYIKALEEESLTRYYDGSGPANGGKGNATIGIGFNMDAPGAEAIWNKVLPNVSFQDVKSKKIDILPEHSRALFLHVVNENEKVLKTNHYNDGYWDKMKANERLPIESSYYQCKGAQVGKNTELCKNMKLYLDTGKPEFLKNSVWEMTDNSNPKRNPPDLREGIQNRNNSQGTVLNSLDCPLYSKPGDKALPDKKIEVIIGKTIIPHKHDNEKCIKSDRYYIWRTKCDNKVRKSCAANESKIFDYEKPPSGGNPGQPYNCGCAADFDIPDYVETINVDTLTKFVRKDMVYVLKYA